MKHNKKRNTAILFEILTQQYTKAVVENDAQKKAAVVKALRQNFATDKVLGQELELYKALYETRGLTKELSERLLQEVTRAYSTLNHEEVYDAQTEVIKQINKEIGQDSFKTFIPNYKSLASIAQLFDPNVKLKSKVLLEQKIVDYMSSEEEKSAEDLQPIDNLVYKKFVERFNEKYSEHLLEEQKQLISFYISSFADNGVQLKVYLNEEIERLKVGMNSALSAPELQEDSSMMEKAKKVCSLLENTSKTAVDKDFIQNIAKIQGLVKELSD
tara:strand:+ start:376 stop:1191 length:816 start_codon:yes stop_codon:yes gene_type:complete